MIKEPTLFAVFRDFLTRPPARVRAYPDRTGKPFRFIASACCFAAAPIAAVAGDAAVITVPAEQWQAMQQENDQLRARLAAQQVQIDELQRRFDRFEASVNPPDRAVNTDTAPPEPSSVALKVTRSGVDPHVIVSGEAGVAFFAGGREHAFPNEEFRVDDAKLFLDAQITRDVFFFTELDLVTRETPDEFFRLGECYLEFADVPAPWSPDATFTLRAGRLDIPFGEEYQRRGVMTNPLISHSVGDLWGVDEGLEIFGRAGPVNYTLAVQNGGHRTLRDFNGDKAVVARLGFNPLRRLHVNVSAMRTGDLDRAGDMLSEVWIGGGFFRALGAPATTTVFSAELAQLEASYAWSDGFVRGGFGQAWYDDDDTAADNRRDIRFFQLEAKQALTRRVYGAARFSRIAADGGFPIVGHGTFGNYFFSPNFTDHLWRLGLGLGYDPAENLRLKVEYTWERGRLTSGAVRAETDQLAAEAGVRF